MQQPQIQVTSSVETLLGLAGAPAAEMDFALPISSKTVERFACDSGVTRVLLGSESTVIDVGRSKRTVSGPARRALNARDGHCRWPGCDRPAKWSAAHHVVHWIHGGSTDLSNLILLWGLLPNSRQQATIGVPSFLAYVSAGGAALDGVQSGRAEALPQLLA